MNLSSSSDGLSSNLVSAIVSNNQLAKQPIIINGVSYTEQDIESSYKSRVSRSASDYDPLDLAVSNKPRKAKARKRDPSTPPVSNAFNMSPYNLTPIPDSPSVPCKSRGRQPHSPETFSRARSHPAQLSPISRSNFTCDQSRSAAPSNSLPTEKDRRSAVFPLWLDTKPLFDSHHIWNQPMDLCVPRRFKTENEFNPAPDSRSPTSPSFNLVPCEYPDTL